MDHTNNCAPWRRSFFSPILLLVSEKHDLVKRLRTPEGRLSFLAELAESIDVETATRATNDAVRGLIKLVSEARFNAHELDVADHIARLEAMNSYDQLGEPPTVDCSEEAEVVDE